MITSPETPAEIRQLGESSTRPVGYSKFDLRFRRGDADRGLCLPALRALESEIRVREETTPFAVVVDISELGRIDRRLVAALASLSRTVTAEGGTLLVLESQTTV